MFAFYELTLRSKHHGNVNNYYLIILMLEYLFPGCSQSNVWAIRDSFPEFQEYVDEYQDEIIDYYIANQVNIGSFYIEIDAHNPKTIMIIFLKG